MRVITGKAKGAALKTPEGIVTRPTADRVKEAVFSMLQFEIAGASVLDLFGGTGHLGIEALSRDAKYAVFVDSNENACKLIRENLKRTNFLQQSTVVRSDYMTFLKKCNQKFNIIFLDPPYAEDFLEKSLKMITEIDILQSGGIIITERPLGKELSVTFDGYFRSKDYKYGNTLITLFRKE
jgi:16S rRNA (guanine(966)-N(2))-methyltransferase RsmD